MFKIKKILLDKIEKKCYASDICLICVPHLAVAVVVHNYTIQCIPVINVSLAFFTHPAYYVHILIDTIIIIYTIKPLKNRGN